VWGARCTKGWTTSRLKKARTLAYIEEELHLMNPKQSAQEEKVRNTKLSRFNAEQRRQADDEVQTVRELRQKKRW
jgi:hypothetical protein